MAKAETLVTPACQVMYPWIFTPSTAFNKEEYSITCVIEDTPEWNIIIKSMADNLDTYYKAQCLANKKLVKSTAMPWREKNGQKLFVVRQAAHGTNAKGIDFDWKIKVVGPDAKPLAPDDLTGQLGNGTIAKVAFSPFYWTNEATGVGVSAKLRGVQILKVKLYDGIADLGFAAEGERTGEGFDTNAFESAAPHTQAPDGKAETADDFLQNLRDMKNK